MFVRSFVFLGFVLFCFFATFFPDFLFLFFPPFSRDGRNEKKSREVKGQLRKMQAALKQAKRKDFYKVRDNFTMFSVPPRGPKREKRMSDTPLHTTYNHRDPDRGGGTLKPSKMHM